MAWTRVDDDFLGHPKTTRAAKLLGRFGLGRVLVVWHQGQSHANRYLTDGVLSEEVVSRFHDDPRPVEVAEALVSSGLWERAEGGFTIHDFLEYNPSRQTVMEKREEDRRRKSGRIPPGIQTESARNPTGIQTESAGNPSGLRELSREVPENFREVSNAPRARASRHGNGNGTNTIPRGRTVPLGVRPRTDVAWPGRPPVPGTLHLEFISKLGGDQEQADRDLSAWYPVVAEHYANEPIGDDDFRFWRARFREWIGTTVPSAGTGKRPAEQYLPPEDETDWFAECQTLHAGECNGRLGHQTRMSVDADRVARAAGGAR